MIEIYLKTKDRKKKIKREPFRTDCEPETSKTQQLGYIFKLRAFLNAQYIYSAQLKYSKNI